LVAEQMVVEITPRFVIINIKEKPFTKVLRDQRTSVGSFD